MGAWFKEKGQAAIVVQLAFIFYGFLMSSAGLQATAALCLFNMRP